MKFGIKLITSMCTTRNYTRQSWKLSWFSAWKISWNLEYAMEFSLELAMDFGLELKLEFEFMRERCFLQFYFTDLYCTSVKGNIFSFGSEVGVLF